MEQRASVTEVYFGCQSCGSPLTLDKSLECIDDQLVTELAAPIVLLKRATDNTPTLAVQSSNGVTRRVTRPLEIVVKAGDANPDARQAADDVELMLVGNNVNPESDLFPADVGLAAWLFDALTDISDVDHPICRDCIDTIFDLLEEECKFAEDEVRDYKRYLNRSHDDVDDDDNDDYDKANLVLAELAQSRAEEQQMIGRLRRAEASRAEISAKRAALAVEIGSLDAERLKCRREHQAVKFALQSAEEEEISLENRISYAKAELDRLEKTNVFNATFHIWHDTHFGTINGFRLGRLADIAVDWDEINNAWGYIVHLVSALAKRMDFASDRRRLMPFGCRSHIETIDDSGEMQTFPLYCTANILGFQNIISFDQGMVAFLEYMNELKSATNKQNSNITLPYDMIRGAIVNEQRVYSIRCLTTPQEEWTRALKCMLINIKWIVTYYVATAGQSELCYDGTFRVGTNESRV